MDGDAGATLGVCLFLLFKSYRKEKEGREACARGGERVSKGAFRIKRERKRRILSGEKERNYNKCTIN